MYIYNGPVPGGSVTFKINLQNFSMRLSILLPMILVTTAMAALVFGKHRLPITAAQLMGQDEFREGVFEQALKSPTFKSCMDSSDPYLDMMQNLLSLKPGRYGQAAYSNNDVKPVELIKQYRRCSHHIQAEDRLMLDETVMNYHVKVRQWDHNRRSFQKKDRNLLDI